MKHIGQINDRLGRTGRDRYIGDRIGHSRRRIVRSNGHSKRIIYPQARNPRIGGPNSDLRSAMVIREIRKRKLRTENLTDAEIDRLKELEAALDDVADASDAAAEAQSRYDDQALSCTDWEIVYPQGS